VCVDERKEETGAGVWSKERKREEWGMRLLGIAINRAERAITRNRLGIAMSALTTDY